MIGLVCLNTMDISNLDTRAYSDDGTEVLENGTMGIMTSGHGDGDVYKRQKHYSYTSESAL